MKKKLGLMITTLCVVLVGCQESPPPPPPAEGGQTMDHSKEMNGKSREKMNGARTNGKSDDKEDHSTSYRRS